MQTEAPDVFDIRKESDATHARHGDRGFLRGCLMVLGSVRANAPTLHFTLNHHMCDH